MGKYLVRTEVVVRYKYLVEADSLAEAIAIATDNTHADASNPSYADDSAAVSDAKVVASGVLCVECEESYNPSEDKGNTCLSCQG